MLRPRPVAYFSAEFGLHVSIPDYSGGLGVLAGDHIKSASDLGIPLMGIGLFYGQGYFRQRLDRDGWQQEEYLQTDVSKQIADGAGHRHERRAGHGADRDAQRTDPRESLAHESGPLRSAAARFQRRRQCSRGPRTYLALYGGDGRIRIRQELLLGVGGFRALKAMGITPGVLHLNEGHSGFAVLEAIRSRMEGRGG